MEKELVWLDCDPGHDDFFAIIFAAYHAKLIGISTVGGNQTLEKVTRNALNALHLLNMGDIPCVSGAENAMLARTTICEEIHGDSGLDTHTDFVWPSHDLKPVEENFISFMYKTIMAQSKPVHIVATGPTTNIALLFSVYPEVLRNVKQVSIMGGSNIAGGNTNPSAEFNVQQDAHALQALLNCFGCNREEYAAMANTYPELVTNMNPSPLYMSEAKPAVVTDKTAFDVHGANVKKSALRVPVVLVPLDVTHTVIATKEVLENIKAACEPYESEYSYPFSQLSIDLLTFFAHTYNKVFGFKQGPPVHDPLAVAYCIFPHIFTATHYRTDVVCDNKDIQGTLIVDRWGQTGKDENCIMTLQVEVEKFWELMIESIVACTKNCPLPKKE